MQKVITIRASKRNLDAKLNECAQRGWKVVSVSKGQVVGFAYEWTVLLEIPDDADTQKAVNEFGSSKSVFNNSVYIRLFSVIVSLILLGIGLVFVYLKKFF
ncbi:MAG: hypothetical protein J1G05_02650 [Clostridiales bacterium]|nr:hypothetical protein [Clostridiales bacterium]